MGFRVTPAEVNLGSGQTVSAERLARAIADHSRSTSTQLATVLEKVAQKELVPVVWQGDSVTLVYNSPNGL